MENKKLKIVLFIIFIIIVITVITLIGIYNQEIATKAKEIQEIITQTAFKSNDEIQIVPTMQDEISDDAVWCCTFQLIWNDLKNDIAKTDIVMEEPIAEVYNLNKAEFDVTKISDDYYYKKYGIMNQELKKEIETGIKDKFGETSSILSSFNWENNEKDRYFLYAMLKRKFEFYYQFSDLDKAKFGDKYENVEYFGINEKTKGETRNQVEVLYYNSKDDFAIKIATKQNDEIILCKGNEGKTFKEIYDRTQNAIYAGSTTLQNEEYLKIPNISFKQKKEFEKLQNKQFQSSTGETLTIEKAIQTIEFKLDKKGGEVKSEAGISVAKSAMPIETEKREFNIDSTFTMFLKESGKDLPYFATKISDITKFQ